MQYSSLYPYTDIYIVHNSAENGAALKRTVRRDTIDRRDIYALYIYKRRVFLGTFFMRNIM